MRLTFWFVLGLSFAFLSAQAVGIQEKFDRVEFYHAMDTGKLAEIDRQLEKIKSDPFPGDEAFEATLLMKKAGMVTGPANKLSLFRTGRRKLESRILNDSSNTELRFLRLMIEEHAPGVLGYRSDLDKDKAYIRMHYKKLLPDVQEAVSRYSRKSKILIPADLTL